MKGLFYLFLIPFIGFTQSNYKISVGTSVQFDQYFYKEYTSNSSSLPGEYQDKLKSGISFNFYSNYKNKNFQVGMDLGIINTSPIDNYRLIFNPKLKFAFNLNFRDFEQSNFIGPVINFGYLLPRNQSSTYDFKTSINFPFGILYSNKFLQFEIGTLFRNKFVFNYKPIFKSQFYFSAGFHIPIYKQPKN